MAGLARMHEIGGRARGGEGGGDFQAHMAALAHAGDDDPAAAGAEHFQGLGEAVGQMGAERGLQRA